MNPIKFNREDHCPICNSDRSIEIFTIANKPMLFPILLDRYEKDKSVINRLDTVMLSHMECIKCKKKFKIQWGVDSIPRPLAYDMLLKIFMDNFMDIDNEGEI